MTAVKAARARRIVRVAAALAAVSAAALAAFAQAVPHVSAAPAARPAPGEASVADPCRLLSDEDVRAVQGQSVTERIPSAQPARRFRVAQCVYRTPEIIRSVSVTVTAPLGGRPPGDVRAYWKERFTPSAAAPSGKKGPPRPVAGLGDEAFWVGDRMIGSLYVLKSDAIVRISVGGVSEEAARLERTKALASRAVQRFGGP